MTFTQKENFIELVHAFLFEVGKSPNSRTTYADIWEDSYRGDEDTYEFPDFLKGTMESKTRLKNDYDMINRQLTILYDMEILVDYAQKELKNYISALNKALNKKDWTKMEDGGMISNFSYNIGGL